MTELRSSGPDHSPSNYSSASASLREKIDGMLAMMDTKARAAIEALAGADPDTRQMILAKLDPQKRAALELILNNR